MCHIGTWSTRYLYEDCRKSLEVKSEKNIVYRVSKNMALGKGASLPSVRIRHSAKESLCRVSGPMTLGKDLKNKKKTLFAECLARWHSAKN